jgi:hypothetical protein
MLADSGDDQSAKRFLRIVRGANVIFCLTFGHLPLECENLNTGRSPSSINRVIQSGDESVTLSVMAGIAGVWPDVPRDFFMVLEAF